MDKGPWRYALSGDGEYYICSDDFKHDVCLYIRGDFADGVEKINYAKWLTDVLNSHEKPL